MDPERLQCQVQFVFSFDNLNPQGGQASKQEFTDWPEGRRLLRAAVLRLSYFSKSVCFR